MTSQCIVYSSIISRVGHEYGSIFVSFYPHVVWIGVWLAVSGSTDFLFTLSGLSSISLLLVRHLRTAVRVPFVFVNWFSLKATNALQLPQILIIFYVICKPFAVNFSFKFFLEHFCNDVILHCQCRNLPLKQLPLQRDIRLCPTFHSKLQ